MTVKGSSVARVGLWGNFMAGGLVNLDALIDREDLAAGEDVPPPAGTLEKIRIQDLAPGSLFLAAIKKPRFQRETSMWSPEKVAAMVNAFLTKELIPAVILWRSHAGYYFIIDGAHRLSCLLAWVYDDYGMGDKSKMLFAGDHVPQREKIHRETMKMVEAVAGGSYREIMNATRSITATEEERRKAISLLECELIVQWVPPGDSRKAESSFFKINEQGEPLSATEKLALHSRDCPNSLASRSGLINV